LLSEWTAVTADEIDKLIGSAPNKTCQLDPVPTWLVKDVRGLVSPFISLLFNKSLTSGYFPLEFKQAVVRPLLKKSGLDASDLKNFRPVSNLSFLSKLLERIAQCRLQLFLDSNDLMPETQSAYRRFHSTETAVTKVYNDLLFAADDGQMSALCLLDLTAAFDTVDHALLIDRLERQFGLRDNVLEWFRSYLSDRTFRVVYGGIIHHAQLSFFVRCHKDQCLVRDCSFCTLATLPTKSTSMMSTSMRMPTIRSCMYIAIAATRLQLLHGSNSASPTSATGCPQTV